MEHGNWKSMYEAACAGDTSLVAGYLDSGVDVNYIHPEFMSTALVSAIVAGREDVALLLLEHGADPSQLSPWEEATPLEAADSAEMPRVRERLIELGASA